MWFCSPGALWDMAVLSPSSVTMEAPLSATCRSPAEGLRWCCQAGLTSRATKGCWVLARLQCWRRRGLLTPRYQVLAEVGHCNRSGEGSCGGVGGAMLRKGGQRPLSWLALWLSLDQLWNFWVMWANLFPPLVQVWVEFLLFETTREFWQTGWAQGLARQETAPTHPSPESFGSEKGQ